MQLIYYSPDVHRPQKRGLKAFQISVVDDNCNKNIKDWFWECCQSTSSTFCGKSVVHVFFLFQRLCGFWVDQITVSMGVLFIAYTLMLWALIHLFLHVFIELTLCSWSVGFLKIFQRRDYSKIILNLQNTNSPLSWC